MSLVFYHKDIGVRGIGLHKRNSIYQGIMQKENIYSNTPLAQAIYKAVHVGANKMN